MPKAAALAVLAKTACVPWAVALGFVRAHVQEDALFVATLAEIREVPTLWHPVVVEAMQEIARIAPFAQAAQPVLAHHLVSPRVEAHIGRRGGRLFHAKDLVQVHTVEEFVHGLRLERQDQPAVKGKA